MMLTGMQLVVAAKVGHQKLDNRSWETQQLQQELCFLLQVTTLEE
jgi:hypothetical protein